MGKTLKMLQDVGLGYLELGQVLTTLSGGEKQRLKLATTLLTNINKHNLYLIDETTTGLHLSGYWSIYYFCLIVLLIVVIQ